MNTQLATPVPLYLGPLDFLPNPTGYGLIGAEVAQWLAPALP